MKIIQFPENRFPRSNFTLNHSQRSFIPNIFYIPTLFQTKKKKTKEKKKHFKKNHPFPQPNPP